MEGVADLVLVQQVLMQQGQEVHPVRVPGWEDWLCQPGIECIFPVKVMDSSPGMLYTLSRGGVSGFCMPHSYALHCRALQHRRPSHLV